MQVVSHSVNMFAPIRASSKQTIAAKPVPDAVSIQPLQTDSATSSGIWEKSSFSFWDIIDAINPLQHIPIISTIYRKITGDEMGYAPRIAGDTLYSGLFGSLISGLVSAVANVFVDSTTGKDIGEHVIATIIPTKEPPQLPRQAALAPIQMPMTAISSPMTQQQAVILPSLDSSRLKAGIEQYKWQTMADEMKSRSNHWG